MATVNGVQTQIQRSALVYTWSALASGATGNAVDTAGYDTSKAVMQIEGTLGTSPTIAINGSNDGTNFHSVVASAPTALGVYPITIPTRFIQPAVTAGTSTSLNFTLYIPPRK